MRFFYSYFFILLGVGMLGTLSSCSRSGCGSIESGYVAQTDTTLNCACGEMEMRVLDTLRIKKGQCTILKFHSRKLSEWLDDNEVIRVGMEPDAPPTFFTKGTKETGFDYELLKAIFPKIFPGIKMEVKGYPYDTLPQLLLQPNPQIEIIAGGYVADTNLKHILWTKPYLTYGYALITKEQNATQITDLTSLKGKKVGVYDDGITEDWLRKNCPEVGSIIKGVDNTETPVSDWMQMLSEGKVDAIVYDYPFAVQELADYDELFVISNKRLNAPNDLMGYSFGVPAGNKRLVKQINEAIDELKKTAAFADLVASFIPDPDLGELVASKESQEETPSPPASKETPKETSDKTKTESKETVKERKKNEAKVQQHDGQIYTVAAGETLSSIAEKIWGDMDNWEDLYAANPHVVSPDIVYTGTILKIPKQLSPKNKKKAKPSDDSTSTSDESEETQPPTTN